MSTRKVDGAARLSGPLPASVTEICPGTLYAVGGLVPSARDTPWLPAEATGPLPLQCYLLRSGPHLVLIDGGLPIHRAGIAAGLGALATGARRRIMMVTRRDVDAIVNMPWLLRDLAIEMVHLGSGDVSPLDFFECVEQAAARAQMHVIAGRVPSQVLPPGQVLEVGGLRLEYVRTPIRVLSTNWIWEASTRSLLSSDCWAYLTCDQPGVPLVARPGPDEISAERILAHLDVKFDWLRGIDTRPVIEAVAAVFRDRRIERVCPGYGRVIEGREAVEALLASTITALERMAHMPRRCLIDGFDWRCCEAP